MTLIPRRGACLALAALVASSLSAWLPAGTAQAQQAKSYPDHPVKIIVPFPPGGSADFLGRQIAQRLSQSLGQTFVVDNRPGGNGVIGADLSAKAAPDGYTLFMPLDFTMTMNPSVYSKLSYDPAKSFAPISTITVASNLVIGNGKAGQTFDAVVEHARKNPGKLTYGAATLVGQLIGEQIKKTTGADIVYVPFKGSADVQQALLSGDVDIGIVDVFPFAPMIKAGKLVALATTGPSRHVLLPGTPTVAEAGFPALEGTDWFAMFAPAGTPADIVATLNSAIARALSDADFRGRLNALGQEPVASSPEQLATRIRSESQKWDALIKAAGIRYD